MFRRSLTLVLAAACLGGLASTALAARVKIRVEGREHTIFGAQQPQVSAATPLAALKVAARQGEFYYHVTQTSFGPYVDEIGLYHAFGSSGWAFKVNGESPPVAADKLKLKKGDVVEWYWAFFGLHGGPKTLLLRHAGHDCYRVFKENDAGKRSLASGAVLHAGHRAVKTHHGYACLKHPYRVLVKATLHGAVRSNALR